MKPAKSLKERIFKGGFRQIKERQHPFCHIETVETDSLFFCQFVNKVSQHFLSECKIKNVFIWKEDTTNTIYQKIILKVKGRFQNGYKMSKVSQTFLPYVNRVKAENSNKSIQTPPVSSCCADEWPAHITERSEQWGRETIIISS